MSSVRRTQAKRREEAEQRLLAAALNIVAQRGSARLTLAEVGIAAGYSRGLPAQRFGNKAGLMRALTQEIGQRFSAALLAAPQRKPGLDAIRGNISVYFSRTDPHWTHTRALLALLVEGAMEEAPMREDFAAYNRTALSFFEHHIRAGIRNEEIPAEVDPPAMALLILGALRGTMMQWFLDDRIDLSRIRDQMLGIIDNTLTQKRKVNVPA
jgi:AcrR family transcriptional regulator